MQHAAEQAPLPPVASFWTGAPLSFIERLCLTSFIDMGHPFTLYSYEDIEGVPDGVELRDASEIMPKPDVVTVHTRTGSPALFSDRLRYQLLRKLPGVIWADTDAYCLRPFKPDAEGYLYGWADERRKLINSGVLALPADSAALNELIAWTDDETAILPWLPKDALHDACVRSRDGDPMHAAEMPWGIWGPSALTYVVEKTGDAKRARDFDVLYPVEYKDRGFYFRFTRKTMDRVTPETQSIHFYGRRVRERLAGDYGGIPPKGTILADLAERHGIEP